MAPARSAAVRCCDEPTAMIVTSLSGSRPSLRSATRVAMSDDEPTLDTPTFLPLRSPVFLMSDKTSRTNGYTPVICATTTRSARPWLADSGAGPAQPQATARSASAMGTETARGIWETSHRSRCARMVRPFLGGRDAVRGPPRLDRADADARRGPRRPGRVLAG